MNEEPEMDKKNGDIMGEYDIAMDMTEIKAEFDILVVYKRDMNVF